MKICALELNNDIKGIQERKKYIESLLAKLPPSDLVFLPELALCSYMASQKAWDYADHCGRDTRVWAMQMAKKHRILLGVGYVDYDGGDYYNRYLIAGETEVYGYVSKCEGEAAVFKRGWFSSTIPTPVGKIAVAICYDAKRKHFYDEIKDQEISLIVFPHGCPADPKKPAKEMAANDFFCKAYADAFCVPVVYINSTGKLEYMPGRMGTMMAKKGFAMNGKSKIFASVGMDMPLEIEEGIGFEGNISAHGRVKELSFYGNDLIKGNKLFRELVLKPDIAAGIKMYQNNRKLKIGKYSEKK